MKVPGRWDEADFPERRFKVVPVSFEALIELITLRRQSKPGRLLAGSFKPICIEGVPEDAVFVHSYTDHANKTGYLVFWHAEWPVVAEGDSLPELRILLQQADEWVPFNGLRFIVEPSGRIIIERDPSQVQAEYMRPDSFVNERTFQDGTVQHYVTSPPIDRFEFSPKHADLQERVAFTRETVRGTWQDPITKRD